MSKTLENLMAAFAGESQANRKYLAFAAVADKEGMPQVAKFFRAAADNHAFDNVDFYVCKVCGYTHEGPCDSCPVCGAKAAAFFKVDDACGLNK